MHAAHRWVSGEAEWLAPIDPLEILADSAADASVAQVLPDSHARPLIARHGWLLRKKRRQAGDLTEESIDPVRPVCSGLATSGTDAAAAWSRSHVGSSWPRWTSQACLRCGWLPPCHLKTEDIREFLKRPVAQF